MGAMEMMVVVAMTAQTHTRNKPSTEPSTRSAELSRRPAEPSRRSADLSTEMQTNSATDEEVDTFTRNDTRWQHTGSSSQRRFRARAHDDTDRGGRRRHVLFADKAVKDGADVHQDQGPWNGPKDGTDSTMTTTPEDDDDDQEEEAWRRQSVNRPVTPVLLPSQLRWPERSRRYVTRSLHQRSRSYDSTTYRHRMSQGESVQWNSQSDADRRGTQPAVTVKDLINQYASADTKPLDPPGVWYGTTDRVAHQVAGNSSSRLSAPRSPSPPRRRHRHHACPTSSHSPNTGPAPNVDDTPEPPRRRRRHKTLDNIKVSDIPGLVENRHQTNSSEKHSSSESLAQSEKSDVPPVRPLHPPNFSTSDDVQSGRSSSSLRINTSIDGRQLSRLHYKVHNSPRQPAQRQTGHVSSGPVRVDESPKLGVSRSRPTDHSSRRSDKRLKQSPQHQRQQPVVIDSVKQQAHSKRPKRPGYSPMQSHMESRSISSQKPGFRTPPQSSDKDLGRHGPEQSVQPPRPPQPEGKTFKSVQTVVLYSQNGNQTCHRRDIPYEARYGFDPIEKTEVPHADINIRRNINSDSLNSSQKSFNSSPSGNRSSRDQRNESKVSSGQSEKAGAGLAGSSSHTQPQRTVGGLEPPPRRSKKNSRYRQSDKNKTSGGAACLPGTSGRLRAESEQYEKMLDEMSSCYDTNNNTSSTAPPIVTSSCDDPLLPNQIVSSNDDQTDGTSSNTPRFSLTPVSLRRRDSLLDDPELDFGPDDEDDADFVEAPITSGGFTQRAFIRSLGFKISQRDGPRRRSLGSNKREKRFDPSLAPARARSQTPTPELTSGMSSSARHSSSPNTLIGHITSLSHSFSFGSRRKLSKPDQSLVVSDGVEQAEAHQKLNGAPSTTNILLATSGLHTSASLLGGERSGPASHGQRSARWAIGFHRLLQDAAGLATFTEFLKKEFSQENIDFWAKCEKYKQCDDDEQRQAEARRLWDLHLSQHSSEAVNVDATTLAGVEQGLQMALPTLFDDAQAHIFQLMKQDSYPRFLKSELYKTCVVAEMEGRPLPYPAAGEDGPRPREDKKVTFTDVETETPITKSKSTVSMDKKRRQSFFPFSWNKSKSEKRLVKPSSELPSENTRWAGARKDETTVRVGVGSLDLVDLNVMSREIRVPSSHEDEKDENSNHGNKEVKLCRVILPDGSTTVLHIRPGTSVRSNLQHLCQRRTLILPALEVFMHATDKAVDLTKDASTLASKEIRVEQRILFQMDLPSRRPLIVRVRPSLSLRDALKPVLPRYNCKVDNMVAHLTGSDAPLDLDASVTKIDGQRLVIQTEEDFAEWGGFNSQRGKPPLLSKSTVSLDSGGDDNDLLKDIMDAKLDVAHYFDDQGVFDPEKRYDKHKNDDGRTSSIFRLIRRNSIGEKDVTKYKNKPGSQKGNSQPATITGAEGDRPCPRPRPPIKEREAENLFEQLNKLSYRLDDQRGDTRGLKDLELPDFLKLDKDSGVDDSGRPRERRNSDSSILDAETSHRLSESISVENISGTGGVSASPVSNRIPYMDQSFSQDGVVPTHAEADALFSTACQYPGSPDLGRACSEPGTGNTDSRPIPTSRDPKRRHANDTLRSAGRHARTPRSQTPDPKWTLLQDVNGYTEEDNDDLSVRPLEGGTVNMEINEYSPPAPARPPVMEKPSPRTRKPAPLPPPRKMLTTPKKFLPPPSPPVVTPRHSHQNSTSSESSHYIGGSSASLGSTPSQSTHDLVVGDQHVPQLASPQRTRPQPPPRPSRRGHGTSGSASSSSADEGGRHSQQAQQQKGSGDNMQVSYV